MPQPTSCCHQIHPPQPTPVHYSETQPCACQLRLEAAMPYSRLLLLLRHTQTRYRSARRKHAPLLVKRPAGHQICLLQVLRSKSARHVMVLAIGRANVQPKAEPVEAESPGTPTQYHQPRIPLGASVRKEPREESHGTVRTVRKGRPLVQKVRNVEPCDPPKQAKNPRAPRHRAPAQQRNVVPAARTNRALHRDVRHQQRANPATT